jgi:putative protease
MDIRIGTVTHYYNRIGVAVLELTDELHLGDTVLILGHTTDLTQKVGSLEIGHQKLPGANPGQRVALKVDEPVRRGDEVYRVAEEVKSLAIAT